MDELKIEAKNQRSPLLAALLAAAAIFLWSACAIAAEPENSVFVPLSGEASGAAQEDGGTEAETEEEEPNKPQNEVFLDADEINYDEHSGIAIAEGNVRIRNKDLRLFAPYVEYDTNTHVVDAYSDHRENVVVYSGEEKYTGKHLKYNVETRRGVFTRVSGESGPMHMQGGRVRMMPFDEAAKTGIIHAPRRRKKNAQQENVAEWTKVTSTTCDFTKPHYRFVSRRAVIFPGKKTVLKRPRFYIGDTLVLAYPFDYIMGRRKREGLRPILNYDSDLGGGFGLHGPVDLGMYGELDLEAIYWTQGEFETKIHYTYDITDQVSLFANFDRLYNDDTERTIWRPSWGVRYENAGWQASLYWAQRELVSTEVATDVTEDRDVWRDPELALASPWFDVPISGGEFRGFATWGRYGDNITRQEWTERFAYGVQYRGKPDWSIGIFKPFYGARYRYFDYYNEDRNQKATDAWGGFSYRIGAFNFASSYYRRWVEGRSPMAWDRFSNSETFHQSVSFNLPIGNPWEKWRVYIGGNYDIAIEDISSIYYSLSYDVHCMTWEFWYRDKRSEKDYEFGLTFFINAYPEQRIEIGSRDD